MEFNPNNPIIQLCVQGIHFEEKGQSETASTLFLQAWDQADDDFEKFIAAHFVARSEKDDRHKLQWLNTALNAALRINDITVQSAFPSLYSNLAKCYQDLGDIDNAKKNYDLAFSFTGKPSDQGPFYHGTKADLQIGDELIIGHKSNYKPDITMNHLYFTALVNGAGLAAELAKGNGRARVYVVEPTGNFENDPNLTDKKFPGNLTRSYRTEAPLKIVGEITDWKRQTPEQLKKWHDRLANMKEGIIN